MKKLAVIVMAILVSIGIYTAQAEDKMEKEPAAVENHKTAVFAGGCFWCLESDLKGVEGVASVYSGYSGGNIEDPSYEMVSSGTTGHLESVEVTYDPEKISYEALLDYFWQNVDPLDEGGQFCDRGEQYRAAIFYADDAEKAAAEKSRDHVAEVLGEEVKTLLLERKPFYRAEDYHQGYSKKNPIRYKYYRQSCGRDRRMKEVWEDKDINAPAPEEAMPEGKVEEKSGTE
ncbi:MAG: peptide-methionine (S)-S-oxide reductase [Alphaproteobacteria bacterium]|nr:MAG: peptide-methionine (S)-S-oxide reductase [Alphaproteobacteria bacterium]